MKTWVHRFRINMWRNSLLVILGLIIGIGICDTNSSNSSSLEQVGAFSNDTEVLLEDLSVSLGNGSSFSNSSLESVSVSPLDPEELAEAEEEAMEDAIAESEQELKALEEAELTLQKENEVAGAKVTEKENVREKAVERLKEVFGLSSSSHRVGPGPAPEFMIELYNTITDVGGVTRARNPFGAEVVRSFLEKQELSPSSSHPTFFYFNLTSGLPLETEKVLEAELHLWRSEVPRTELHPSLFLNPFYVLSLYQVKDPLKLEVPDLHKLLAVHYVPALGAGWQVFNVKKAVSEWVSGHSENHGFLVSAESVYGDRVPIQFARRNETVASLAESKQPILVLFNEDALAPSVPTPSPGGSKGVRRKVLKKKKATESGQDDLNDLGEENQYTYEYETTPLSSLENPRFHHSLLFQDSIRHPNSASRFRSRRSRNETFTPSSSLTHHSNLTKCGIQELYVSFETIGWSSWIISPKGIRLNYCEGPCTFPLGKEVSPTNHATLQSIINELNLNPGLPRPCCVPTTLLPISLLYYDDQDNVVLKQYVDMVAENCGCH